MDDKSRASTPLSTDILSHKDAPSKSAVGTPLVTSHSNGSQLKVRLSLPPKERESPDPTEGPPAKRAKTVRGSPRPDGSRPIPEVMIERLDQDSETNSPDTEQNGPSDSHVGTALPNSNANDKPINILDEEEDDLKPIAGFAVRTKDDLKALSRVRKLLKDEKGFADQQSHLMGFLFGDNPEVPQLRGHTERTPGWYEVAFCMTELAIESDVFPRDNPWEEHGKSMGQTKLLNGRR